MGRMRLSDDRITRSNWQPGEIDSPSPHRFGGAVAVGFDAELPDEAGETLGACVLFARARQVLVWLDVPGLELDDHAEFALESMAEQLDAMARRWPIAFGDGDDPLNPGGLPGRWGERRAAVAAERAGLVEVSP